jgi:predicted outer membrane repeat protein
MQTALDFFKKYSYIIFTTAKHESMRRFFTTLLSILLAQASLAQISGPLSGTLGPGTYHVIGNISVESGDSLRLLPGTTFTFDGPYPFKIYGILLAEGTAIDSIIFTTDTLTNPDRWRGLRFYGSSSSSSRLAYCLIENGLAPGVWPDPNSFGGGVYLEDTSPSFSNCVFANDSAQYDGGAVYCSSAFSAFTSCIFSWNSSYGGGGAVSCIYSSPHFVNCSFVGNRCDGGGGAVYAGSYYASFTGCAFMGNSANLGGAVYRPNGDFTNCLFAGNSSRGRGGAIFGGGGAFRDCIITGNSAGNDGGGICAPIGIFINCVIAHNTADQGGGIFCGSNHSSFLNCILVGNSAPIDERGAAVYCGGSLVTLINTLIVFSEGAPAIFFDESPSCHFEHCDIFGNNGGNFDYWTSQWEDAPADLGLIDTVNANGDSCDTYMNIYLNPLLRDIENGDYHLMWTECGDSADSPCIDAGDPTIHDHTLDCDWGLATLISDISGFGGDTVVSGVSYPTAPLLPSKPTLFQNYPNPFNPTTEIEFDLPKSVKVELRIYNILGQEVAVLASDFFPAGAHRVSWNAASLPSGIYICRMEAAGFMQTRKMLLVK